MKTTVRILKLRYRLAILGTCSLLLGTPGLMRADDADYGSRAFGGSSYVQHGPGPAYSTGYTDYGGNATGIEGRFSSSYGEYGAVPGYGRFGTGSSFGSGPLRAAGTGRGGREMGRGGGKGESQNSAVAPSSARQKRERGFPF